MLEAPVAHIEPFFKKQGFNTGTGNIMRKFMFAILCAVPEMERELTVKRIRKGMAKAKCYGTRSGRPVGRPPRQIPASFKKCYSMWKDGDITATAFARLIGASRQTLYKDIAEHNN